MSYNRRWFAMEGVGAGGGGEVGEGGDGAGGKGHWGKDKAYHAEVLPRGFYLRMVRFWLPSRVHLIRIKRRRLIETLMNYVLPLLWGCYRYVLSLCLDCISNLLFFLLFATTRTYFSKFGHDQIKLEAWLTNLNIIQTYAKVLTS